MALNPGDALNDDHYCIIRQLGRGGFDFVYLAQEVAIKELIPALVRVCVPSQILDTVSPCIPDRSRG